VNFSGPPVTRKERQHYLVDEDVLDELGKFSWFPKHNGYLRRYDNKTLKNVMLHSEAWRLYGGGNPVGGEQIDHINHDVRDNRRCNLRRITAKGNQLNRQFAKGVMRTPCGSWRVKIGTGDGKFYKHYDCEETARLVAKHVRAKLIEREVIEYLS